MTAKYIVRLDDASVYQNMDNWLRLDEIFSKHNVRPIVGIIPDNKDPSIISNPLHEGFWDLARSWQERGWTIALHGLHHVFHKVKRSKLIFPYYDRSEFGGLTLADQKAKVSLGLQILKNHGLSPKVWMAPAHTFDRVTLQALIEESDIRIISDGVLDRAYSYRDFLFLPQQIWTLEKKYKGVWTICLHPETMASEDFQQVEGWFQNDWFSNNVVDLDFINNKAPEKTGWLKFQEFLFWSKYFGKQLVKFFLGRT